MSSSASVHRWRFFRAGGLDQVRFDNAEDYRHLEDLDQKLWVALACPVKGIEFDERTLALIDLDHDGRVRAPEVIAAVQWAEDHLKDLGALKQGTDGLPLDQINDQAALGRTILASARQILKNLGKSDASVISLGDVADTAKIFAQTKFNGDGIVPSESASDPALQQVINEILATQGPESDRSGKPGVSQAKVDDFFAQLTAMDEWARQAETQPALFQPLGEATVAAVNAYKDVAAKVDDYFGRCRLVAFDPRALSAARRKEEEYLATLSKDVSLSVQEVAGFPLARVEAESEQLLSLTEGLNPAWIDAVTRLREAAVQPLLGAGKSTLRESEWLEIKAKLSPHIAWVAGKPQVLVEALGLPRIRAILGTTARADITQLIAQDKTLEAESNAIESVERLIRYYRDLHRLLSNFVTFADFYDSNHLATFQVGTLYLDGRACELCVRADDPGKHAALAGLAKTYLAYCDCTRSTGEKMSIAAAFTHGDSDNLMVGRNGLFYDRRGRDWDATITKIIENPISIRQAIWAPYKKLVRLIEEQVAKRAAAAEADAEKKLSDSAATAATLDKSKLAAPTRKIDVGTVAALGVAFGAIGTAIATVAAKMMGLIGLPFWQIVLALAAILLLISGPSIVIAWLKLRQRNLAPILDANGWAVNGRVKVPVPLARSLTSVAKLPPGTVPAMDDRFAEAPAYWPKLLAFVLAIGFLYSLLNHYGFIYRLSGGKIGVDPNLARTNQVSLTSFLKGPTPAAAAPTNAPATNAPAPP